MLLPQTLDISYSGVHGNKKFPTVEGPEVVRQGKRADVAWAGVEASRKFYFGILNFPVPESRRRAQKFYFSILNFLGHFCWC